MSFYDPNTDPDVQHLLRKENLPARFPLIAADRRTAEPRRSDDRHPALDLPMPSRLRQHDDIDATVRSVMTFARACAATGARWDELEALVREAIAPTFF